MAVIVRVRAQNKQIFVLDSFMKIMSFGGPDLSVICMNDKKSSCFLRLRSSP
jgi:hypothetical protein